MIPKLFQIIGCSLLCLTVLNAQGSSGGGGGLGNNPQTSLAYPVVEPIFGPFDPLQGIRPITGYNITVDIVMNPMAAPLTGTYTCSMSNGLIPNGVFNRNFLFNQTVRTLPSLPASPTNSASGYRYFARLNAVFVNVTNGIASLPPFIRGDCMAGGGTVGAVNSRPFSLFGVSPTVTTVGSWKPVNNPSYATGNPWGPISLTGLDMNRCTNTTEVVVMVGPLKCNLLSGSSGTSAPLSGPHCSTLIANPTVQGTGNTPSRWDVYCTVPVLAGTNLPVTVHLIDTVRNSSVASSNPDNALLFISATAPVITAVDMYADAVTAVFTRYTIAYGTNTTTVRDVPASSTPNTEGRIIVALGSNPGICPRVELRTNTTILRVWQFAASSAVSAYCGLNATLLGNGNTAALTNFPSSGLSASTLDLVYGLGFRLVVGDGIRVPTTTEVYFSDSEVAGGGAWLVRYAAPTITAVSTPVFFRAGTLGAPFYRVNVTGTNFGPVNGPFSIRPTATIGGLPCSAVARTSDTMFTLTTPVGSGNGLSLVIRIGDNDGLSSFSYPTPVVESLEAVGSKDWKAAATLAAFSPRSISIGAPRRHPRGATLNVTSDSVVIVRGRNFGPWKGNGTKTNDMNPANVFWEFDSYGININAQCIAAPWAGRGNAVAAPNCNGILDYVTEGELPNSGTILYWNDTMIAFAAPPAGAGFRELVINFASGVSTYSSTNWFDFTALLHYGTPVLGEYGLLEMIDAQYPNASFVTTPASIAAPMVIPTAGGKVMYITGPFFQTEETTPPMSITVPAPLPANRSELFNIDIPDLGMVVFAIGQPSTATQCILRWEAVSSAFALNSAYLNPAVPVACRTGIGAGSTYAYTGNNSAVVPLPAGNGANISVVPMFFDAIPDPVNKRMTVVQTIASAAPQSIGGSTGVSVIDNPIFSYAEPTITVVTPQVVSIKTNLATVTTRFTLYGTDLGVEDTNGCAVGAGAPAITTAVEFVPSNPNAQSPIGGYSLIPEMGLTLGKVKGTGSTACSSLVNTYGYFPNLPVGRYGVRVTVSSTLGSLSTETSAADGVAFTCGAGYYGQDGQRCVGCGAFTGASCPGGNATFEALDLGAPVIANAGYYNYFGDEEIACPPNTPINNKPTGRNVCIAQCNVAGSCLGNNQCATGYTSSAPNFGCGRCDTGYVRVNASQCGAITALSTSGDQCVLASVCTNAGTTARVINGIGDNGEDVCWCNSGEAPSPSASPSYLPPSPSPSSSASNTASPSASGTPAAASSTPTPTPSGTRTSSPTPTPSSSVAPNSCSDNLVDGDETDVDCGGKSGCAKCSAGLQCRVSTDCIGAAGGSLSDAVCSDATLRCTDVRTGGGYWDSIISGGGSGNSGSTTPLSFVITLNATVSPAGLTTDGLETLRVIFETVSKQQIVKGGIANDAIYTVGALSSVIRTGMIVSSSGRRMLQSSNVSGVVVLITATIIVAPTSSAPSGWDASVKDIVARGAFSPASMAGPLSTALSSSSSTAWSSSASNGQLSMQSSSTDAKALVSIVSVENAVRASDGSSMGIVGVAVFLIALVGLSLGMVMHSLRTKGHFLGYRMTPLATVFGMVPLSDNVKHSLRINSAGKYGRKLHNRNIMGMANPDDVNISTNPIANGGLSSAGVTYMMPSNNVPMTTYPMPVRTSFAPSGTDYSISSGNPMNGMAVNTPLAMYTSPRVAARQGSMMFTTNTGV